MIHRRQQDRINYARAATHQLQKAAGAARQANTRGHRKWHQTQAKLGKKSNNIELKPDSRSRNFNGTLVGSQTIPGAENLCILHRFSRSLILPTEMRQNGQGIQNQKLSL